jgi:hypothetical protein
LTVPPLQYLLQWRRKEKSESQMTPCSLYIVHYFRPEPYGTLFPIYSALLYTRALWHPVPYI